MTQNHITANPYAPLLREKCVWYYFMGFVRLFLICHPCPVHKVQSVSADVLFLPVQLSLLHAPVNLFKKCIVLLSTEYFYTVSHLISWLNLILSIPQPNAFK